MASKPHHDAEKTAIITDDNPDKQDIIRFKPRAFNIVWGNDRRYWKIPPASVSSSSSSSTTSSTRRNYNDNEEVAELVQVSWLEVTSSFPLQGKNSYKITFKLSLTRDAFGWSGSPVFLMAKVGKKGKYKWKKLKDLDKLSTQATEVPDDSEPFIVDVPEDQLDTRLYFGLYEVWSGKWKGGLRVHEAIVKKIKY